jgi:hypothetical protein
MMVTRTDSTIEAFYTLLSEEYGKDFYSYFIMYSATQRLGQAFFNSLPPQFQLRLGDSNHDPFHSNSWASIVEAIEFLTTK